MQASKRGQKLALAGLVLQTGLTALAVGLWYVTATLPALPVIWLIAAPIPVWLLALLLFYCRFLERREARELEELAARGGDESGLFAGQERDVRPAAHRLWWMERYLVWVFTLLQAGYHIALGVWTLQWVQAAEGLAANTPAAIAFAVAGAFAAFLMSRYAIGLGRTETWRLLRAPGSYLFVNSLALAALAVVLVLGSYEVRNVGRVAAYVLSAFLMVLGVELVLNLVLDLYRPRIPGAKARPSYESRLLNLIASPERIGRSIAEALNYQFGFEVSSTWFYQLLQKSLVPLLLSGGVILWLLTAVIVVEEGETYVVLRWGKRYPQRLLTPRACPYLVYPWPVDTARKFETGKVQELLLGVGGPRPEEIVNNRRIYLWSREHGTRQELNSLVAKAPHRRETDEEKVPSVDIIKLVVGVYYQIEDAYRFGYEFTDAAKLLEGIAHREMVQYAASATLDEPLPAGAGQSRPQGIMSFGREQAEKDLLGRVSDAVARYELGVRILRVELLSCHPSIDAAPAFEDVIAAEREQDELRYEAQAEAKKMLAAVAGEPDMALRLAQVISFVQDLENLVNVRDSGGDVDRAVRGMIQQTKNEIEKLSDEIELDRLLGRIKPADATAPAERGRTTTAQDLLVRQREHLALLERVQADPKNFDLAARVEEFRGEIVERFEDIQGAAAVEVALARAYRWKTEFRERSMARAFPVQLMALAAAPSLYRMDKHLEALSEGLADRRKYILALDDEQVEIWLNLEEAQQPFEEVTFGKQETE